MFKGGWGCCTVICRETTKPSASLLQVASHPKCQLSYQNYCLLPSLRPQNVKALSLESSRWSHTFGRKGSQAQWVSEQIFTRRRLCLKAKEIEECDRKEAGKQTQHPHLSALVPTQLISVRSPKAGEPVVEPRVGISQGMGWWRGLMDRGESKG